jgi:hypothetical protein
MIAISLFFVITENIEHFGTITFAELGDQYLCGTKKKKVFSCQYQESVASIFIVSWGDTPFIF